MKPTKRTITAVLCGVGLSLGAAGLVNAAASTDSSTSTTVAAPSDDDTGTTDSGTTDTADDAPAGPHTANGTTETALTGDEASSVEAAVLAANPGATIERMETDADGAAYEAHVTLADGSEATVKLDDTFAITATETGGGGGRHGGGPGRHGGGPHGANGITEEELTGDTAASVQAAVLAAQPGATIERMETDAEGAAYEAHVTLADGSEATVKLDSAFTVTDTETD